MLQTEDGNAQAWHDLLVRARRAEHQRDVIVEAVLSSHEDEHSAPAKWCTSRVCRLADELRRR